MIVCLVVTGIGGISYHLFRKDGWLGSMLGTLWNAQIQYAMVVIPVAISAIVMLRLWSRGRVIHGRMNRLPDFIIYALIAIGAYFIGRYLTTGAL